jgi:hypothetical protein
LREDQGVIAGHSPEGLCSHLVREDPIAIREHRVRRLTQERMAKVVRLATVARVAPLQDLLIEEVPKESRQGVGEIQREKHADVGLRERATEDARRTQYPACGLGKALKSDGQHREDSCWWRGIIAVNSGADEFL